MRAARRQPTERPPVWFMRQAGRVLPEYRAIREKYSLLEISRHPDVCTEVTLQPVRRFAMDAAILFADIMHPLVGAGVPLDIVDGVGPVIETPVRAARDVEILRPLDPEADLPYVLETIRMLKRELGDATPLIGFAGAPFTLAAYLIEGRASREFLRTKTMMYEAPDTWHELMTRLADMVIAFMRAQRAAGVDVLQLFDSWVGALSRNDYVRYVQPYTRRIFAALAPLDMPLIHFGVNTATLLDAMATDGASIIGADWRIPLDRAWTIVGQDKGIQGNLDPTVLLGPPEVIAREVGDVLDRADGRPGHIFNLGHGLLPQTPIPAIEHALATVRERHHAGGR
ncbi:MAG: uroporphyrinogen decarboxylase [Gemmatimonadota bacterium]|nr:uroporphyrinogen decarboxylase [Gemmatimonadota bacterium]MDE3171682.1 uroporphyrinogen decarboxylase [Gemmatimonadota bacterium]MDE3215873.1 uroporphyrinogen decarboxylase [Gemmatimonadota bacterium]